MSGASAGRTLSFDFGFADGEDKVGVHGLVGDWEGHAVEELILEKHDRVAVSDGSL